MCLSFSFSLGLHIGLHVVCNSMLQFVLLNISRSDFCITKVMFFSYKKTIKRRFLPLYHIFFKRSDLPYIAVFYRTADT